MEETLSKTAVDVAAASAAVTVVSAAVAAATASANATATKAAAAVGPALRDGIVIRPALFFDDETETFSIYGANVFCSGKLVFSVNEVGRKLLDMADGATSIDDMVERLGINENASDAGLFFVAIGKAGYLKNRIEIEIYETRSYTEEYFIHIGEYVDEER